MTTPKRMSRRALLAAGASAVAGLVAACQPPSAPPGYEWRRSTPSPTRTGSAVPTRAPRAAGPAPPESPRGAPGEPGVPVEGRVAGLAVRAPSADPVPWRLTTNRETIKGFADKVSAADGERVGLYVTTPAPWFDIEVYRLGWYEQGTSGARLITSAREVRGGAQAAHTIDRARGLASCAHWHRSAELQIVGWPTGLYLLKLVASDGDQNYVPLVIRDDVARHDFLFEHAVATDQAYNNWGGKSLYGFNSTGEPTVAGKRAVAVSYDRPLWDHGAGENLLRWELNMVRFLEANRFDVAYATDLDVHRDPQFDARVRAVLQVGHNEYWSKEMRDHLESARGRGKGLGFFTGDTGGYAIRFEDSALGKNRVQVCYKGTPDPIAATDPTRATSRWAGPELKRPTNQLTGVGTNGPVKRSADWIVEGVGDAPELFAGTGFKNGDVVRNLIGYEYDGLWQPGGSGAVPANVKVLGRGRVLPTAPIGLSSRVVAAHYIPGERQPRAGRLSAGIDPSADWAIGSVVVQLAAPGGAAYLQYKPGGGAPSKYRDGAQEYGVLPLGAEGATAGPRALERDLLADYAAAIGPPPAELRVRGLELRGGVSLGPTTLTARDGTTSVVGLDGATPEAAGWRLVAGEARLTIESAAGGRRLALVPTGAEPRDDEAHSVMTSSPNGGLVIAVGTIQWSWALDAHGGRKDSAGHETTVDPRLQALTRNMLRALRGV